MADRGSDNFHFFLGRLNHTFSGIKASEVPDPYGNRSGLVTSIVVGSQLRMKREKPVTWAQVIPPGLEDIPKIVGDRRGNDKIVRGSIIAEDGKNFLVSHRDEKANYMMVRTGLMAKDGSTAADRLEIQKDGKLMSHGSYSFDNGSVRVAMAENPNAIEKAMIDPGMSFGKVAAERMGAKAVGGRIPLIGCPESAYVLWRMPFGSVLIIRDVNGAMSRIVSHTDGIRRVDAKGYASFFEKLEESYRKQRDEQRKERNAARAAAQISEQPQAQA
jgi:hypothetical protein